MLRACNSQAAAACPEGIRQAAAAVVAVVTAVVTAMVMAAMLAAEGTPNVPTAPKNTRKGEGSRKLSGVQRR